MARRSRAERHADFSYVRWGINRVNSLFKLRKYQTSASLQEAFTEELKENYPDEWSEILQYIEEKVKKER